MSDRIIPLHVSEEFNEEDSLAFTDVIVVLYLEGLPFHTHESEDYYESGPLTEAVIGSFALGCAVGIDFQKKIPLVLQQTHPNEIEYIIANCTSALDEQIKHAKDTMQVLEPEDFVDELLKALEDSENIDTETAQNAISMSFEYGLIMAHSHRSAALVLRNAFDRSQAEALKDFEEENDDELPPGPDPYQTLQSVGAEIMEAYESDIGFSQID